MIAQPGRADNSLAELLPISKSINIGERAQRGINGAQLGFCDDLYRDGVQQGLYRSALLRYEPLYCKKTLFVIDGERRHTMRLDFRDDGPHRAVQFAREQVYDSPVEQGHIARHNKTILMPCVLQTRIQPSHRPDISYLVGEDGHIQEFEVSLLSSRDDEHIVAYCLQLRNNVLDERMALPGQEGLVAP